MADEREERPGRTRLPRRTRCLEFLSVGSVLVKPADAPRPKQESEPAQRNEFHEHWYEVLAWHADGEHCKYMVASLAGKVTAEYPAIL